MNAHFMAGTNSFEENHNMLSIAPSGLCGPCGLCPGLSALIKENHRVITVGHWQLFKEVLYYYNACRDRGAVDDPGRCA